MIEQVSSWDNLYHYATMPTTAESSGCILVPAQVDVDKSKRRARWIEWWQASVLLRHMFLFYCCQQAGISSKFQSLSTRGIDWVLSVFWSFVLYWRTQGLSINLSDKHLVQGAAGSENRITVFPGILQCP